MEKTNKYYSIIENLVKKHKKFPGYEAILDDIIDDVYSHSEVIINSINNENVINAYLEKVISTSIITVPKKLNFHQELRHRTIRTDILPVKKDVNTDLIDKMINSSSNSVAEDNLNIEENTGDEINIDDTLDNIIIEDENNNTLLEPQENNNVDDNDDLEILDYKEDDAQTQEEIIQEDCYTAAEEEEEEEENEFTDLIGDETTYEDSDLVETLPEADENIENLQAVLDDTNIIEEAVGDILELPEPDNITTEENLDNEELILSDESGVESNIEVNTPEITEDFSIEEVQEDLSLDIQENSIDEVFEQEELSDILTPAIDSEEDFAPLQEEEQEIFDLDSFDTANETIQDLSEDEHMEETPHMPVDYSVFDYKPEAALEDIDVEEIIKDIEELNQKRPELNIIKVYELKYKTNCSVDDIASSLEMSKSSVLEALNEIIAVV